jgi:hypothetical protein
MTVSPPATAYEKEGASLFSPNGDAVGFQPISQLGLKEVACAHAFIFFEQRTPNCHVIPRELAVIVKNTVARHLSVSAQAMDFAQGMQIYLGRKAGF